MIVGEDADVYGDVESEERREPERQNKYGKDPTSHGYGDGDGYDDAGGGVRNANGGSMLTSK